MKMIVLFSLLFLLAGKVTGNMENWRVRNAIKPNDIVGVMVELIAIDDFYIPQSMRFRGNSVQINFGRTFKNSVSATLKELKRTDVKFFNDCVTFLKKHLRSYCEIALKMTNGDYTDATVRRAVRFVDEHLYCLLTAFYDAEMRVDMFFRGISLLSTIEPEPKARDSITDLGDTVQSGCKALGYEKPSSVTLFAALNSKLENNKQSITAFSKMFCTRWPPFLSRLVIHDTGLDYIRNMKHFIYHVHHREKCTVNFKRLHIDSEKQQMVSWTCDRIILESEEYRYKEYKNSVTEFPVAGPIYKLFKGVEVLFCRKNEYTLFTLREILKSRNHYLNLIKYYNIASTVMLLVSIKEGNKIFKGIKYVVRSHCDPKFRNHKSVEEVRELRTILSAFKVLFDKLVFLLLDKKRVNLTDNQHKKIFNEQVDVLMTLLVVRDDMFYPIEMICIEIEESFLNNPDYDVHLGDKPHNIILDEYYLTEPLFHINQLYHFVANNF